MAETSPADLIETIEHGNLEPTALAAAAEALGSSPHAFVAETLVKLVEHRSPLVREGAVYGLAEHMDERTIEVLRALAESDPSPGVRDAARFVLD
jgi:HEAT repeat protein